MKARVPTIITIDVPYVHVTLPVRYEEEDIPNDFPLRDGDTWAATIEIDTGRILEWPKGIEGKIGNMKVCDEGIYTLLDTDKNEIRTLESYVPHGLIPGEYGDYVALDIGADGIIKNWPKNLSLNDFYEEE